MASSPVYKVYTAGSRYVAATKFPEDAAVLVAAYGDGATIRWKHTLLVWREGAESQSAAESYDFVACVVQRRLQCVLE